MDKVEVIVFDITALNSGRLNGACVLLEQKLNWNILFFLLILTVIVLQAVFVTFKVSVMSGSDILLFKRFNINWVNLDSCHFSTWTSYPDMFKKLKYVVNDVLQIIYRTCLDIFREYASTRNTFLTTKNLKFSKMDGKRSMGS